MLLVMIFSLYTPGTDKVIRIQPALIPPADGNWKPAKQSSEPHEVMKITAGSREIDNAKRLIAIQSSDHWLWSSS